MVNPVRHLCLFGALAATIGCGGGTNIAFREGRKAELRHDWDSALVNYEKAVQSDPANALYLLHEKQARSQASLLHLKKGRLLRQQGRLEEAAGEFQQAVRIDPSNQAAETELSRLLARQAETKRARENAIQQALKPREETPPGTVQLRALPSEPLAHFRISADSRKVFEALGKLANLNVVFSTDFRPTQLSIDLTDIKIEDALRIVAHQTKSFWTVETPNSILILPDTPTNRRDFDEEVIKIIYLSNPLAAADRTAITTALKQVLGLQKIIDNPDANAIVVRDTPAKVAAAEDLVRDLDRGKGEILIEIEIVEADSDRVRDLGLTPATISSSGTVTPGIEGALAFSPSTSSSSSSSSSSSGVQLGSGLSFRDYAAVLPSAYATAVLNDSKTHILQSPQVRVTDGQTAKLKIGSQVPYATGSFLPSLTSTSSTSSTSILASTQFQYKDVGVNLELTPHLLESGEVAIHAKIEISTVGSDVSVAGVSEPTFGQRVIEHDIRLREGEVSLLGGLLQSTQTNEVQGIPGLGNLPLLHYFFSQDYKEVNDVEVLVMLTPRVICLPDRPADGSANARVPNEGPRPSPETPGVLEPNQPSSVPNTREPLPSPPGGFTGLAP